MDEMWVEILGFENYIISNKGNIRQKPKDLSTKIGKSGAVEVSLNKNGKSVGKMVGRLVYEAFTGRQLTKDDVVVYLDGDKTNCNFDNLKVISRSEREKMAYDIGEKDVRRFEFYGEYLTLREIAERTGIKQATLEQRVYRWNGNIYEAVEVPLSVYDKKEN